MIELNEFSMLLLELNSPNYSLAIGSKNQYNFTQMHNPNIKIHSVHLPPFLQGWAGWASNQIFKKGAWQNLYF